MAESFLSMQFSLKNRLILGLAGVLLTAAAISGYAVATGIHARKMAEELATENLEQARAIYELQIAIMEARVRGQAPDAPDLATGTAHSAAAIAQRMARLEEIGLEPDQQLLLGQIEEVLSASIGGGLARILSLPASTYDRLHALCVQLSEANERDIVDAFARQREEARRISRWLGVFLTVLALLISALCWLLLTRVFKPLRRMAGEARTLMPREPSAGMPDEMRSVETYLGWLTRDIAEARNHLARSERHLLDAEKFALVARIAAGVAHEVRSPLTALRLRVYSMRRALGDLPDQLENVGVISEELTRLENIVRNFLDFSRPPDLRMQPSSLPLLIDRTLNLLRYRFDALRLRFDRDEPSVVPAAMADPQQLQQVLVNLLNNAIDASREGGTIRVAIAVESDGRSGCDRIAIRIGDNGTGVPSAIRNRLFEPFVTGKPDGAGLGLWIARSIALQHGGGLDLERTDGHGSVFILWIPTMTTKPTADSGLDAPNGTIRFPAREVTASELMEGLVR